MGLSLFLKGYFKSQGQHGAKEEAPVLELETGDQASFD